MKPGIIAGEITRLTQKVLRLHLFSISHHDSGSDRASVGFSSDQFYLEPVVLRGSIIAQERGGLVQIHDDNVEIAIIIEISESAAAAGMRCCNARTSFLDKFFKTALAQIPENNTWSLVRKLRKDFFYIAINIPGD